MHKDSKTHSIKNKNKKAIIIKESFASIKEYENNTDNNGENN